MLKKIVTAIIVLPLLIVPLFCVCMQQANAATIGVGHCHDDNDEASPASHHNEKSDHNNHECSCGHECTPVLENIQTSTVNVVFLPHAFTQAAFENPIQVVFLKGFQTAYLGPPPEATEVPLYIQHHSLRI